MNGPRRALLATAILSLTVAGAGVAPGEDNGPEIRGISLGMTPAEVRGVAGEVYPGARILEKEVYGTLESLVIRGKNDTITVRFTMPPDPPRATSIHRGRTYGLGGDRPGLSATRTALREKYGAPTAVNDWIGNVGGALVWQLDPGKQACVQDRQMAHQFVVDGCSRVLIAELAGTDGLLTTLVVQLTDPSVHGLNRRAFQQWTRDRAESRRRERVKSAPSPPEL